MVITGALLGAMPASAATWTYSANQCVSTGILDTRDSWLRYWGNSTITTFNYEVQVACPAMQQGGSTLATVTGRKWYSTDTLTCKLIVADAFGGNVHTTAAITVTAGSSTPFTLDLTAGTPYPFSYAGGSKVIACKIPHALMDNAGELYTYTVTEL